MESSRERCEKCVGNFLYEVGITSNKMVAGLVDCEFLVYRLAAVKKEDFVCEKERAKYILKGLGRGLESIKVFRTEKFRIFNDRNLDEKYKNLISNVSINIREDDKIVYHDDKFVLTQDEIEEMDGILGLLSNDWPLQKAFTPKENLNKKIAEIVAREIKENIEVLIKDMLIQVDEQIIKKIGHEEIAT